MRIIETMVRIDRIDETDLHCASLFHLPIISAEDFDHNASIHRPKEHHRSAVRPHQLHQNQESCLGRVYWI